MAIAGGIVAGGGRDAVAVQPFGDRSDSGSADVLGEDAGDERRRDRVGFEPVEFLSVCGLAGVRVHTGVGKLVAVRRPTTEESPLVVRLGLHGGLDPDLDAPPFALAHAAVEAHRAFRERPSRDRPGLRPRAPIALHHGE